MRILHLSVSDLAGGAARAAYRQHLGLVQAGIDSKMYVQDKRSADPTVIQHSPSLGLWKRIQRRARRSILKRQLARYPSIYRPRKPFSDDRSENKRILLPNLPEHDLINIHLVPGFVDHLDIFSNLAMDIPIVYTLHDLYGITGGCHYTGGCFAFEKGCGACPQLKSEKQNDFTKRSWRRKQAAFLGRTTGQLVFVGNSQWTGRQAQKSGLTANHPVKVIHYGLNLQNYRPLEKSAAREVLGLEKDKRVVVFSASYLGEKRKGTQELAAALKILAKKHKCVVATFGGGYLPLEGMAQHHFGVVDDERLMSLIYSAGDIFLMPSLEEAFGQTALEALACGTPVVGFDAGGIPDMVRQKETGFLVTVGDSEKLAEMASILLEDDEQRKQMGKNGRSMVEAEFSMEINARNYIALYSELSQSRHK